MNRKSARKSDWKVAYKHSQSRKKTKLAFLALFLVFAILIVGNLIKFTHNLFMPISQTQRNYRWDGTTRINLTVKSDQGVSILSFDPSQKVVTLISIPPETYIETPGGYGSWEVRSIYDLGQAESPPKGAKLLNGSLNLLLGLPIDGFLQVKGKTADQVVKDLRSAPGIKDLLLNINTDLSPIELLKLGFGVSQVRFDKVETLNLKDLNVLEEQTLAGSESLIVDPFKLDALVIRNLSDSQIKQEELTVAVINATDKPGLASLVGREITNMGGNVIIQTSSQQKASKTFIGGKDSYTKKRLTQIFCPGGSCDKIAPTSDDFRAQINLVIGEDFIR